MNFINIGTKTMVQSGKPSAFRANPSRKHKSRSRFWLVLISAFTCFALVACSTLKAPTVGTRELTQAAQDWQLEHFFTLNSGPKLDKLFNQAIEASYRHNWAAVIESLKEGYSIAPTEQKPLFLLYLMKMTDRPFPITTVCKVLLEIDPTNKDYYQQLLAWSIDSPMILDWPDTDVILPWLKPKPLSRMEISGLSTKFHPIVEVVVNGLPLRMILDTGAAGTVVFADSAKKAGLVPVSGLEMNMVSSNELSSQAKIALTKMIKVGGLSVRNSQSWIVPRPYGTDSYDGLVGWPILSQLSMELDARAGRITLRPPQSAAFGSPNFVWLSQPIAITRGGDALDLVFFLVDTGADRTWFSEAGITKLQAKLGSAATGKSHGVNGGQSVATCLIKEASFFLDGKQILFLDHTNFQFKFPFLNAWDGNLGSDIAQAGILRLDFPAGRISFAPYPTQK